MSAFNGSGVFTISGTGLPVVTGTTISSTVANTLNTDLATGLSTALCKDGQSTPTANIKMGGFKFTGLGVGTSANDSITFAQLNSASGTFTPADGSGATLTFTTPVGYYRTVGNIVHIWGSIGYPATASGANSLITGLPFTSANLATNCGGFVNPFFSAPAFPGASPGPNWLVVNKNATTFRFATAAGAALTNANLTAANVDFYACYPI